MIYPDWQIERQCANGLVTPYNSERVQSASIDLCLADTFIYVMSGETRQSDRLYLTPQVPVIVSTVETIKMPTNLGGQLVLKSSMGRQAVQMCNGGWVDPGFHGTLSVTLYSLAPITLRAGQPFVQMILHMTYGKPDKPYQGKYQHQQGPTMARLNGDMKTEAAWMDATTPQPQPTPGEEIVLFHVLDDLKRRAERGKETYGTYLETFNDRDALVDAYQEALDLCMYLKQALLEREAKQRLQYAQEFQEKIHRLAK